MLNRGREIKSVYLYIYKFKLIETLKLFDNIHLES